MESELTELEMDAVLQLIQLSSDSVESGGSSPRTVELSREESSGGSNSNEICSAVKHLGDQEALPRRQKRFRSIGYLYRMTSFGIRKAGKKSSRNFK